MGGGGGLIKFCLGWSWVWRIPISRAVEIKNGHLTFLLVFHVFKKKKIQNFKRNKKSVKQEITIIC